LFKKNIGFVYGRAGAEVGDKYKNEAAPEHRVSQFKSALKVHKLAV
jgi:hypothetical protein